MSLKFAPLFKVRDFINEQYHLVQSIDDVQHFNEMFNEDYSYYFVENNDTGLSSVFGADSFFIHNNAYYVGEL